ncbi:MAG TPA: MlaD family protein [Gammaproteobacteria bacterium]|nr:MlaD family protein [Gammaproteobacteria bacterium]
MTDENRKLRTHYIHHLSYTTRERLVGAFVLLAILLLFMVLVFNKQTTRYFQQKFELHALIHNAQGISTDTHVIVSGLDVGNVTKLGITPDNRIAVTMKILEKFHKLIRTDSRAGLSKLSVLGNTAIEISAGSGDKPLIPDGATIALEEPLSVDQILAQVVPVLDNVKATLAQLNRISTQIDPQQVGRIVQNLAAVSASLKSVSGQMAAGHGSIGKLLYDPHTEANLTGAVQSLNASLKTLQPLLDNANTASAKLPKLVTQLDTTLSGVNAQMQSLPAMVLQTRQVLDDTDRTLRALQNTWPISSSVTPPPANKVVAPRPPDE